MLNARPWTDECTRCVQTTESGVPEQHGLSFVSGPDRFVTIRTRIVRADYVTCIATLPTFTVLPHTAPNTAK
jgi:hypothetical protein